MPAGGGGVSWVGPSRGVSWVGTSRGVSWVGGGGVRPRVDRFPEPFPLAVDVEEVEEVALLRRAGRPLDAEGPVDEAPGAPSWGCRNIK